MRRFLITILFSLFLSSVSQGADIVTITDIDVIDDHNEQKQHIVFSLDRAYKNLSSIEYNDGFFKLILPNVTFDKRLSIVKIGNELVKNIRLSEFENESFIDVELQKNDLNLTNRIDTNASNKTFEIIIDLKQPQKEAANLGASAKTNDLINDASSESKALISDASDAVFLNSQKQKEIQFGSSLTGNFSSQLIQSLLALLFILAIIFIFFKLYLKFFQKKTFSKDKKYQIKILDTYHINPKQKIIVISIRNYTYACSVSPSQINLIGHIPHESFDQFQDLFSNSDDKLNINKIKALFHEKSRQKETDVKKQMDSGEVIDAIEKTTDTPNTSFADEFLSKVKKLKSFD